jgi:L-alanine-DL-glutamate epimerase-like enolase superfamily enzyme
VRITTIKEGVVSMAAPIRNAYVDFSSMTASVVAVVSDLLCDGRPLVGLGFSSNGRYAQRGLLRERFIPRLLEADAADYVSPDGSNIDPEQVRRLLLANEKPGGHGERSVAVALLETAVWDLVAKIEGKPVHWLVAERYRGGADPDESVFVYAAGGYYTPDDDLGALRDEIASYLDEGYTAVKMKIGGASVVEDMRRIEAVIDVVGDSRRVAVDANGRFDLETARAYGDALGSLDLFWFEEPGDPLDFELMAELTRHYPNALATGENLFSLQDARNLIRYSGMRPDRDWLQFDPVLSYGVIEYVRILEMLEDYGWSPRRCIPHGGHQLGLNLAAGLRLGGNESYPRVFAPFGGFADGIAIENGRVRLPDVPGIGFEAKAHVMDIFEALLDGSLEAQMEVVG